VAAQRIGSLIPKSGPKRRLPSAEPNDLSVVLLVQAAGTQLLLGGDLEVTTDVKRGWKAIVSSNIRPKVQSVIYKVAHHGSPNADCEEIWSELLEPHPYAVLTPYAAGPVPRPAPSDVRRIKKQSDKLYQSSPTDGTSPPKRRGVDRTVKEIVKTRHAVPWEPGHVRIRMPFGGRMNQATVELAGGARML
jgi:hypothetical protein